MEREVNEILEPLGVERAVSQRVAADLLRKEGYRSDAVSGWVKKEKIGLRVGGKDGLDVEGVASTPSETHAAEGRKYFGGQRLSQGDDVGMTAFLIKVSPGFSISYQTPRQCD